MVVLVTCKNEEDPIKNEGDKSAHKIYVDFSDALLRADNSVVSCDILLNIQAFMNILNIRIFETLKGS